ncbi:MAG: RNB domain-containing ribonuclease [Treponema sp.]|nr:RNB domain-containing ribonuclease [Treponema sp.]
MISNNALVIYKNKPALVRESGGGKISILLQDGSLVRVRDKDIELIHPGPVTDFGGLDAILPAASALREAWELFSGEDGTVSLKDIASLVFGEYTPSSAYAAYSLLLDGLYFSGTAAAVVPRGRDEVAAEEARRGRKQQEIGERVQFMERLKACLKKPAGHPFLPEDARFIQDVEALAYGKSVKSRTMRELGLGETPEDTHALLLKTGFWTNAVNPYPSRLGLSLTGAGICPDKPPDEDRRNLCHIAAFAIDSSWSADPDDAVSIEKTEGGGSVLYVHIADPAASVSSGSPAEIEARNRGVTLYLPESTVRMLAEEFLPVFALGGKSLALTFRMTFDEGGRVMDTEIFPSVVNVRRLTYEEADIEMDADTEDSAALRALHDLAALNYGRRSAQGAVNIELPEVHISIENGIPHIKPLARFRSASIVRECMIMAGEAAGIWAAENVLAVPYISQEADIPGSVKGGLYGSWQLRRCMRPRVLSVKPGRHQGLGLDIYTQVTSPLRRYTDLLAHIQIRAFLRGEKLLSPEEVSARLGFSEAAAYAAVQAERASCNHWIMVYLSGKKDSVWDAVTLEKKGNRTAVIIPSLALETQALLEKDTPPDETVRLVLKSVNIPKGEAVFVPA